jgi:hypothetical protein
MGEASAVAASAGDAAVASSAGNAAAAASTAPEALFFSLDLDRF